MCQRITKIALCKKTIERAAFCFEDSYFQNLSNII
jgi:hypothetical protein